MDRREHKISYIKHLLVDNVLIEWDHDIKLKKKGKGTLDLKQKYKCAGCHVGFGRFEMN